MEPVPELIRERPRSCWLEIDLGSLRHNYRLLKRQLGPQDRLLAVVKAEAYGHGAALVSRTLSKTGVDTFGVATLEEALKLREYGIDNKILILGHLATFTVDRILEHNLTPVVFSFRLMKALNEAGKRHNQVVPLHLKVDTGMGRLGLLPDDLDDYLRELNSADYVKLEGVATHFAQAGEDTEYTDEQIRSFEDVAGTVRDYGLEPDYWHCMNSAAFLSRRTVVGNMIRPGITLYGYPPTGCPETFEPVMQVKTKLADYKCMPPGKGISYGRVFQPEEPTWIGVMPLGYADGYPRSFSNKGYTLKQGRRCPVLGRVCMDMTMIELSESDDPEGIVTVMGQDGEQTLWADELAEWDSTIPYEILCSFSERLPRIYLDDDRPVAIKTEQSIREL